MTFERDNGKVRLQRPRLRNASRPASNPAGPGRTVSRRHKTANRSLLLHARAIAGELPVGSTRGDGTPTPEGAQELAREALRVFRAFVNELGFTASPTARTHALAFAMQSAAAQWLTFAAAAAGLDTPRGLALLEQGARCQGRAERSATAAIALAGLFDRPRTKREPEPAELAYQRLLAEQEDSES